MKCKRLLSILLCVLMLFSLVACGNGGTESNDSQGDISNVDVSSVNSDASNESTTTTTEDIDSSESSSSQSSDTQKPSSTTSTGTKETTTTTTKSSATTTTTSATTTTTSSEDNFTGVTYYVSSSTGDDWASGETQEDPVKSLSVAGQLGGPGDRVLFKRGDIWRGESMALRSGVTYGAYGSGENPQFYGSAQNYSVKSKWKQSSSNKRVWYYDETFSEDIGGIVFNDGDDYAVRAFSIGELNSKNEYCFMDGKVYLFSRNGNPAEQYKSIEFLPDIMIMDSRNLKDVTVQNITFKYAGRMGFYSEGPSKNVRIENCDFSWMGGVLWGGSHGNVRLGNGIGLWGSCINFVVTNCKFNQIYDTAFTPQYENHYSTEEFVYENVEFSNNSVNKCHYGVEIWLETKKSTGERIGTMKDIKIVNNVMRNAGRGWSANQRGEAAAVTMASHLITMNHPCPNVSNFVVKGNVFDWSAGTLIDIRWDNKVIFEGNTYIQKKDKTLGYICSPAASTFDNNVKSKILAFDKTAKVEFSK